MTTTTLIITAFVLFIVGVLFLLFGKIKNPIYDLIGFFFDNTRVSIFICSNKIDMVRDLVIAQYEHVIEIIKTSDVSGTCAIYVCTKLHSMEAHEALAYFKKNRPTEFLHPEFYKDHTYSETSPSWWHPLTESDRKSLEPFRNSNNQRIKFLKHLIKQLKKETEIL